MPFKSLGLEPALIKGVEAMGFHEPTPIQKQAIPCVLAGEDIIGCAQTGTGKTAAFVLPALQRLSEKPGIKALIVTPTRELAHQIEGVALACAEFTGHSVAAVVGGVPYSEQEEKLARGVDLLVATPGRLLDFMRRGRVKLSAVELFVLDEADRMLDMGFWPDVKEIVRRLPAERQTMLFSATMPPSVLDVISQALVRPVTIRIEKETVTVEGIDQSIYPVDAMQKADLLLELLKQPEMERVLVFSATKRRTEVLHQFLLKNNVSAASIHSDLTQAQRETRLAGFKSGRFRVLLATDIVARGIDVDKVTHVINYDIPDNAESYVHRIGRTARAGATGTAISLFSAEELASLREIEAFIGKPLPCRDLPDFGYRSRFVPTPLVAARPPSRKILFNGGARKSTRRRARRV
jgi:ATP-dependent RNA helicase RhlE